MGEKVERKPFITKGNKRDAKNHPEFLDTETLYIRFKPLIISVFNHFSQYNNVFNSRAEREDLYNQVVLEFVRLTHTYNPRIGVDFPGFLKMNLAQRVSHFVNKESKKNANEYLTRNFLDSEVNEIESFENSLDLIDTDTEDEQRRIEGINMLEGQIHQLSPEEQRLCRQVLLNHKSIQDIANEEGKSIYKVSKSFDELLLKIEDVMLDYPYV